VLARQLPLPIPEPVAIGRPDVDFPRAWSIYRWIEGEPASHAPIADLANLASQLAGFLCALYAIEPSDGPPPGTHNFWRGGPLDTYDAQTRGSIRLLTDHIDVDTATAVWDAALASTWDRSPVWVHGDVAASNLIVAGGRLKAVIDFGCSAVGDPACDLVFAWTFCTDDARTSFRDTLALDDATWARARGWALWKAVITLAHAQQAHLDLDATTRRWGWRTGVRELVDLVLDEHRGVPA
jgi:aminoglycoside phosphotransferase (APT) family kinase protein